jgi:hypothetical protein
MKAKAFLTKVNGQAKINNEDFNKALEAFPDVEIPDVWVNLFEDSFLTRERAAADVKIINKIRAEVLDGVDNHLETLKTFLDPSDVEKLDSEKDTFKKLKLIKEAFPAKIEKVKKENPDANDQVKELKKTQQELLDKLAAKTTESEKAIAAKVKEFEQKETEFKRDYALEKEFSKYTFADEFGKTKDAIIKVIKSEILTENVIGLGENGQIQVQYLENGVAKPKFNGNDQVTIDSLLTGKLDPFLKKNNAGEGAQTPPAGRTVVKPPSAVNPSAMTLSDRRRLTVNNA